MNNFCSGLVYPVVQDVVEWSKGGVELDPKTTTLEPAVFEEVLRFFFFFPTQSRLVNVTMFVYTYSFPL